MVDQPCIGNRRATRRLPILPTIPYRRRKTEREHIYLVDAASSPHNDDLILLERPQVRVKSRQGSRILRSIEDVEPRPA